MAEHKVTSTEHVDSDKPELKADINGIGEDMKSLIDTILQRINHAPWGGPGNSKDQLSKAVYDLNSIQTKLILLEWELYAESRKRSVEDSDADDSD